MDPNIIIYNIDERDGFGQYAILPGQTHVFPFVIPLLGNVTLTMSHILPNTQDFSIDMWISSAPLDGLMLREGFGHYKPIRRSTQNVIYDFFLKTGDEDDREFLISGQTYYLNVKNLQNSRNAYQLTFD